MNYSDVLEIVKPIYNFKASGHEIKSNSKEDIWYF